MADPVGHSLSPLIHNTAFRHEQIDAVYLPFRVPREHLDEFLDSAAAWDLRGLSVTIPHKEAVLDKLTKRDDTVQRNRRVQHDRLRRRRRRGYEHRLPGGDGEPGSRPSRNRAAPSRCSRQDRRWCLARAAPLARSAMA